MKVLTEIEIYNEIDRLRDENCDKLVVIGIDENGDEVVYDGRVQWTKEIREEARKSLKKKGIKLTP